jgi:predicted nucleic acid-binding Zn ribbon protein
MLTADQPQRHPPEPAAGEALCGAPGCGRALTPAQVGKGARACSDACRRAANRARQRDRRLAEIDAAILVLQELRAEIARGTGW